MDEDEFERLTDKFKGDYRKLLHAYNELEAKYDRLKTNLVAGIVGIALFIGYIYYQSSNWFAGVIVGTWAFGIIGILAFVIVATAIRLFRKRR